MVYWEQVKTKKHWTRWRRVQYWIIGGSWGAPGDPRTLEGCRERRVVLQRPGLKQKPAVGAPQAAEQLGNGVQPGTQELNTAIELPNLSCWFASPDHKQKQSSRAQELGWTSRLRPTTVPPPISFCALWKRLWGWRNIKAAHALSQGIHLWFSIFHWPN